MQGDGKDRAVGQEEGMSMVSTRVPCCDCKSAPQYSRFRCKDCFRINNRDRVRIRRARRSARVAQLEVHTRVCIDCRRPFLSQRGFNLCWDCNRRTLSEATAKNLFKHELHEIGPDYAHTILFRKYGHKYKATVTPRIPLSTLDVFAATGRRS